MGFFEEELRVHEDDRHRDIAGRLPHRRHPSSIGDGFVPPAEAAAAMRVTEAELYRLVARGEVEHRVEFGDVVFRPAIIG